MKKLTCFKLFSYAAYVFVLLLQSCKPDMQKAHKYLYTRSGEEWMLTNYYHSKQNEVGYYPTLNLAFVFSAANSPTATVMRNHSYNSPSANNEVKLEFPEAFNYTGNFYFLVKDALGQDHLDFMWKFTSPWKKNNPLNEKHQYVFGQVIYLRKDSFGIQINTITDSLGDEKAVYHLLGFEKREY
jgi:hypothetical protein